jgi:predicted metal-dependent RNase
MILYLKTLKTPQKHLRVDSFNKVVEYKIHIKTNSSLYTHNEEAKKEIRKIIPFTLSSKN